METHSNDSSLTAPELPADIDRDMLAALAPALQAIGAFVIDTDLDSPQAEQNIGQRFIALAWITNPELVGGQSMRVLARSMGVDPTRLYRLTSEASTRFGITNRAQSRGWNRGRGRKNQAHTIALTE